jgi:pimeloyl-ACP methyl ester carboxylesterase
VKLVAVSRKSARVKCPDGLTMGLDVFLPEGESRPLPVAVVCHGFKGFKDWGFFPPLAERLAARGRALAVFDFSHNGIGDRPGEFDRLDLFARQTLSRHVQDLGAVLDFLDGADITREANLQRARHFNVVGHSYGGAVAVLRAADDARITQVTTLNGVAELQRFSPEQVAEGRRTGKIAVKNQRTGQDMPVDVGFLDDAARHDLEGAATQIFVPALLIQGEADPGVTPAEGRQLNEWIPGSRLVLVPGADHVFGAKHPFAGWTPALEQVARELDAFLPHVGRLGGI